MNRSTAVRLVGLSLLFIVFVIGSWILVGPRPAQHSTIPEKDCYRFPDPSGSPPKGIEQRGTTVTFPELQGRETVQLTPISMAAMRSR